MKFYRSSNGRLFKSELAWVPEIALEKLALMTTYDLFNSRGEEPRKDVPVVVSRRRSDDGLRWDYTARAPLCAFSCTIDLPYAGHAGLPKAKECEAPFEWKRHRMDGSPVSAGAAQGPLQGFTPISTPEDPNKKPNKPVVQEPGLADIQMAMRAQEVVAYMREHGIVALGGVMDRGVAETRLDFLQGIVNEIADVFKSGIGFSERKELPELVRKLRTDATRFKWARDLAHGIIVEIAHEFRGADQQVPSWDRLPGLVREVKEQRDGLQKSLDTATVSTTFGIITEACHAMWPKMGTMKPLSEFPKAISELRSERDNLRKTLDAFNELLKLARSGESNA